MAYASREGLTSQAPSLFAANDVSQVLKEAEKRKGPVARKRRGSALVIVDLRDGCVELVDGHVENSAYAPVCSADGKWIFFGVPFERAMYAIDTTRPKGPIDRVDGLGRWAPMPMADLASARPGSGGV